MNVDLVTSTDIYFTGVLERGSAILTLQVAIKPDYPKSAPVFALSLVWNGLERTALTDESIRVRRDSHESDFM